MTKKKRTAAEASRLRKADKQVRDPTTYLNQLSAWGITVPNVQLSAAHIAEGLVTLLAAADGAAVEVVKIDGISLHEELLEEWQEQLVAAWGEDGARLGATSAVRALGVPKTKHGPVSLSPGLETVVPLEKEREASRIKALAEAGLEHVRGLTQTGTLERDHHLVIAGALAADKRLRQSGASTPTTPGPDLIGYDSNYTFRTYHAAVALGLLADAEDRRQVGTPALLPRLVDAIRDDGGPHTQLVHLLGLDQLRPGLDALRLPVPSGRRWREEADRLYGCVDRLLRWQSVGGQPPKAELLMALVDLVSLFFSTRVLTWTGASERAPGKTSLLVAPRGVVSADARTVIKAARFTIARAASRLERELVPQQELPRVDCKGGSGSERCGSCLVTCGVAVPAVHGNAMRKSEKRQHQPWTAAIKLGASAGWFYPPSGGSRYVSPGDSQLRVLVQALVEPGTDLSWGDFSQLAWDTFGLCMGDHRERDFAHPPQVSEQAIVLAGALNQRRLLEHGLGRREADNVVMVDGGGA